MFQRCEDVQLQQTKKMLVVCILLLYLPPLLLAVISSYIGNEFKDELTPYNARVGVAIHIRLDRLKAPLV